MLSEKVMELKKSKIPLHNRKKELDLVSDIELFYKEYEETHKEEFFRNEFKEHKKMLRISGKIFKRRIDMQVNQLWILNEKMKEDKCLAEFEELTKKVSEVGE
jgi:hypothetical protein